MREAGLLLIALLTCIGGFGWLALAMEPHWRQVRGDEPLAASTVRVLRVLGSLALAASFVICLQVDHVSMASLVWIMALAAAAMIVAFTLTWQPRLLSGLVAWMPRKYVGN